MITVCMCFLIMPIVTFYLSRHYLSASKSAWTEHQKVDIIIVDTLLTLQHCNVCKVFFCCNCKVCKVFYIARILTIPVPFESALNPLSNGTEIIKIQAVLIRVNL